MVFAGNLNQNLRWERGKIIKDTAFLLCLQAHSILAHVSCFFFVPTLQFFIEYVWIYSLVMKGEGHLP